MAEHPSLPYTWSLFAFVESLLVTRLVYEYLFEDEYLKLQQVLVENPEAGDLISGGGGVRPLSATSKT